MKDTRQEVNVLIQVAEGFAQADDYQGSIAASLLAIAKLLNEVTNGGDKLHIVDGSFRGI